MTNIPALLSFYALTCFIFLGQVNASDPETALRLRRAARTFFRPVVLKTKHKIYRRKRSVDDNMIDDTPQIQSTSLQVYVPFENDDGMVPANNNIHPKLPASYEKVNPLRKSGNDKNQKHWEEISFHGSSQTADVETIEVVAPGIHAIQEQRETTKRNYDQSKRLSKSMGILKTSNTADVKNIEILMVADDDKTGDNQNVPKARSDAGSETREQTMSSKPVETSGFNPFQFLLEIIAQICSAIV